MDDIIVDIKRASHGPVALAFKQAQAEPTDNSAVTLVAAVAGKQINVYGVMISTDTNSKFTFSSDANTIYPGYASSYGGHSRDAGEVPHFGTNVGEALKITMGEASLNAGVHILYRAE